MRQTKRIPVTREGFEKLQREYDELKKLRPAAVQTLSEARSMGDLSENGLYTAAKMRLRGIDSQLFRLSIQIKLADIQEGNGDRVGIGSTVVVSDGMRKREFRIVGDYEAEPSSGKISSKSPIGKKLMGLRKGDETTVNAPGGEAHFTVLKITME